MESNFLSEPNVFLLSLVEAIEDELAFYSQDNSGKFVYLSKSAEKVLNHPLELWKSQTLQDAFSDAPCNQDVIQAADQPAPTPASVVKKRCEIIDREGNRLQLDVWQMRLVRDGVSIGHSGIIRRLDGFIEDALEETAEEASLAAKVASLTTVERLVIELVVDGHMNKEMAAKLDVAVRTIESRRSRGMVKLQVSSLPQLVQLWVQVRNMEARKRTEQ
jgi:DNA-binding CsgD family transcriptional regulator